MSPTHLIRTLRDLPKCGDQPSGKPFALLILVLFVIWLLAAGHDLASAVAAAVTLSWAASSSPGGGTLPPGADMLTGILPAQPPAENPTTPARPRFALQPAPARATAPRLSPPKPVHG